VKAPDLTRNVRERIAALDARELERSLDEIGHAHTPPVLDADECRQLIDLYTDDRRFRKRVDMARVRFGVGDYAYFAEPLPRLVRELRTHLYRRLAPLANRWVERLGESRRFPGSLGAWLERCHAGGQTLPTPLVLRYAAGGYNRLHQDLYGELVFPLQVAIFLSRPGDDYGGGAFLLVENRAREQSIGDAILPQQGEMLIFPTALRPVPRKRGFGRAAVRHGVARLSHGERYVLGVIFHDAH
jgi:hypothetical protein